MSAVKHTPGRWAVRKYVADAVSGEERSAETRGNLVERLRVVCKDEPSAIIADVARFGAHTRANANVIAAAPDLLDALDNLLRDHDEGWPGPGQCPCETSIAARAALAKAKGTP